MSLGAIYFWGIGQVYPKYDHPFFSVPTPWVAVPHDFSQELKDHPQWIAWVDVFRDSHGTLVVDKIDSATNLVEVLKEWKGRRIILNIKSNVEDIDRELAEFLPAYLDQSPILLQSEYDIILRSTKESLANLPFGSSQSDRLRLNSYQGMAPWPGGLLSAAPFHGDAFITPLKWKSVPLVNELLAREIHRRQKYLIIGPLMDLSELHLAQSLGADGVFITNKTLLETMQH